MSLTTLISDLEEVFETKAVIAWVVRPDRQDRIVLRSDADIAYAMQTVTESEDAELHFAMQDMDRVCSIVGTPEEVLNEEGEPLEEGKHSPFKRFKQIGIGPRDDANKKRAKWRCKCSNYTCQCTGVGRAKGRKKTVQIDRGYKAAYNKEYKAWRAAREPYEPSGGAGKSGRGGDRRGAANKRRALKRRK